MKNNLMRLFLQLVTGRNNFHDASALYHRTGTSIDFAIPLDLKDELELLGCSGKNVMVYYHNGPTRAENIYQHICERMAEEYGGETGGKRMLLDLAEICSSAVGMKVYTAMATFTNGHVRPVFVSFNKAMCAEKAIGFDATLPLFKTIKVMASPYGVMGNKPEVVWTLEDRWVDGTENQ